MMCGRTAGGKGQLNQVFAVDLFSAEPPGKPGGGVLLEWLLLGRLMPEKQN